MKLFPFYFTGTVRDIIPIYPLYAIMFGEHGVSPFGLSVLFIIWSLSVVLFEVPSGALADRFGRKWLIVVGVLFKTLAYLTWFLEQNFIGYALGFILWGFGSSLRSGAWEALLYEILREEGRDAEFARHHGRIGSFQSVGVLCGELLGGLLIVLGYDVVLLVSAAVPIIAILPFAMLVSDVRVSGTDPEEEHKGYWSLLREGVAEAADNLSIRFIFLAFMFLLVSFGIFDEYISPLLHENGFELSTVAYLSALLAFCAAVGEFSAERFNLLTIRHLLGVMGVACVVLLVGYWLTPVGVVVTLCGYCLLFAMANIQFHTRLQEAIEGDARATVTSTIGFAESVGGILWLLVFGAVAEISFAAATLVLAATSVVLCLVFHSLAARWAVG